LHRQQLKVSLSVLSCLVCLHHLEFLRNISHVCRFLLC
jgi:hypothetical protein